MGWRWPIFRRESPPQYRRRCGVSLPCSGWERVGPPRSDHQPKATIPAAPQGAMRGVMRWWSRGDSNPWPPPCKGGALPAELRPPEPASSLPRGARQWAGASASGPVRTSHLLVEGLTARVDDGVDKVVGFAVLLCFAGGWSWDGGLTVSTFVNLCQRLVTFVKCVVAGGAGRALASLGRVGVCGGRQSGCGRGVGDRWWMHVASHPPPNLPPGRGEGPEGEG